ncbi:carbohydrate ABC transporter permease [Streptomyces turgidiscabies]|uniref:ABC transporter, permease protein n=1 Tax=Streptomyces turgidiscabies (strain Car8) TaxID=698760 RepID=L7F2S6_STRT8|nr:MULTISPECIES: carbohydrate ABC transporter permease [Streptomyces]ELP65301.1 ABC transporter, permease protein [Streptomyces turgidiscabies Car8]MDX3491153.1 carbohydrate ABC transporter permease [Streptomyces turgidiscabies]GAQ73005.1 L-arabinose transport system permease protein [Streptomyces turgidiscabies]
MTTHTTRLTGKTAPGAAHRGRLPVRLSVLFVCALWIVPTLGVVLTSFRSVDDANSSGWWTLFAHPGGFTHLTTGNYGKAVDQADLGHAFLNSVAITLPAVFLPLLIAAFAAYAFTFMTFPGRDTLFIVIVSLLVVPNYVAFVPIIKLYASVHLNGTYPAAWLAHIGFGMSLAVYILRNYMATLPKDVIESAKIDGASHFQTFYRLILPMSAPALASFAIFQFLWVWNDLLVALIFVGPGDKQAITVATNSLLGQQGTGWELVTAGGLFSMLVPILVFLTLQRYFVRGLTSGAVKG